MQITIRLDPDLFVEVMNYARSEKQTFNETVAHLCEWGLEIVDDEKGSHSS
jgi:hypothetical protein